MMTGIKLVYIEDLGSTVYSASFWTLLIVASSSDIGLILFWTWLIVASSSDIGLILFCNSSLWGLSCLVVITARSPKVWPPLINSHSFMQRYLTNQKSRRVSSWLLIGLNLHERMWITQSGHTSGLFAVKAKNCYTNWFLASIKWGPARWQGGPMSPIWIWLRLMSLFINACRLLSALLSLSQFGQGRLSLIAISFYAMSLLFGPCCLSEVTLAGPLKWLTLKIGIIPPFWKESNGFFKHCHLPWGSDLLVIFSPFPALLPSRCLPRRLG